MVYLFYGLFFSCLATKRHFSLKMSHSCNSPGAQYNLGVLYENGHGVDQSESMAMRWYAKAAAQGDEDSQTAISRLVAKRRESLAAAGSSSASGDEAV